MLFCEIKLDNCCARQQQSPDDRLNKSRTKLHKWFSVCVCVCVCVCVFGQVIWMRWYRWSYEIRFLKLVLNKNRHLRDQANAVIKIPLNVISSISHFRLRCNVMTNDDLVVISINSHSQPIWLLGVHLSKMESERKESEGNREAVCL